MMFSNLLDTAIGRRVVKAENPGDFDRSLEIVGMPKPKGLIQRTMLRFLTLFCGMRSKPAGPGLESFQATSDNDKTAGFAKIMWRKFGLKQDQRQKGYRQGLMAEHVAACLLWLKGFRIVEKRFRCPVGEIDLIARRGNMIAFVEVKFRSKSQAFEHAISASQSKRIVRAAEWYCRFRPQTNTMTCRFDAIFVGPRQWPQHIKNAWQCSPSGGVEF